jgi:two-component system, LuxR family, response regulator FixJ
MAERRKLVLIVDDDRAVREALQFALRLEGLCVHVHGGAATLLADPDLSRAACLIVDDRMPRMDGFALLDRLRAGNAKLPAIMLTSHVTPVVRARAEAAGVSTVLEKPLLDDALIDSIRSILTPDG